MKPETNPETWYVNEKFLVIVDCYISLERSWKVLFTDNIFGNIDWNYYHLKPETNPETWYVNEKFQV